LRAPESRVVQVNLSKGIHISTDEKSEEVDRHGTEAGDPKPLGLRKPNGLALKVRSNRNV